MDRNLQLVVVVNRVNLCDGVRLHQSAVLPGLGDLVAPGK